MVAGGGRRRDFFYLIHREERKEMQSEIKKGNSQQPGSEESITEGCVRVTKW